MSYLDLNGFQRYASKQKEWALDRYASLYDANWTKTAKAGAVTCWPVGGSRLEPSVDFMFTETPPASGDKGPDNPSTITGVSSIAVTRCNENLIPVSLEHQTYGDPFFITSNGDGSFILNGYTRSDYNNLIYFFNTHLSNTYCPPYLRSGHTYTFSLRGSASLADSGICVYVYRFYTSNWGGPLRQFYIGDSVQLEILDNVAYMMRCLIPKNLTFNNEVLYFQIKEGSEDLDFIPAETVTSNISLGNTYYGGTLDVATGVLTVTWAGATISNVVNVDTTLPLVNTLCFAVSTPFYHYGAVSDQASYFVCDRFISAFGNGDTEHIRATGGLSIPSMYKNIYINRSRLDFSGAADPANPTSAEKMAAMSAWLTANPTIVCARLFTPYTVRLTPTQILALDQTDKYTPRLNTIYSDQQSVQVGYSKSPIRDEYEKRQAIIASGGE